MKINLLLCVFFFLSIISVSFAQDENKIIEKTISFKVGETITEDHIIYLNLFKKSKDKKNIAMKRKVIDSKFDLTSFKIHKKNIKIGLKIDSKTNTKINTFLDTYGDGEHEPHEPHPRPHRECFDFCCNATYFDCTPQLGKVVEGFCNCFCRTCIIEPD